MTTNTDTRRRALELAAAARADGARHDRVMDLRAIGRAGDKLERARRLEEEALNELALAVTVAAPRRRKLLLAERISRVPRTTIRRRVRALDAELDAHEAAR